MDPSTPKSARSLEESIKEFKAFEILQSGDVKKVLEAAAPPNALDGTTILHLAVQCAEPPVIKALLDHDSVDVNAQDRNGNTALHLAASLGRPSLVSLLLKHDGINSFVANHQGHTPIDEARNPAVVQQLQLERAMFLEKQMRRLQEMVHARAYDQLETFLEHPQITSVLDVNAPDLATDAATVEVSGTLLHEAARHKDLQLIELLLTHGADPFVRDRKGKLPQDVTRDEKTRALLKRSPAATTAQRGIQEKAILGSGGIDNVGGRESREIKGYLKKWVNYTTGYKLRWFVLENGVLSYYKHQDDAGSACRGAMNMRIAQLSMDASDKTKFEIIGKSSVKYHLRANHAVEAKRWFWALNNAIRWAKDEAQADEQQRARPATAASHRSTATRTSTSMDLPDRSTVTLSPEVNTSRASFLDPKSAVSFANTDDATSEVDSYEPSVMPTSHSRGDLVDEQEDDEDDAAAPGGEPKPVPKDAFNITAHSANLQLEILSQVARALSEQSRDQPKTTLTEPTIQQALGTYSTALSSLKDMVGDLLRIARDRDAYWQFRLSREADMRRMWEESMAQVAREQQTLEGRMDQSEEKRKRTKRALRDALDESMSPTAEQAAPLSPSDGRRPRLARQGTSNLSAQKIRRKSTIKTYTELSDSDSDDDEEFFDAVGAGEVPVEAMPTSPQSATATSPTTASLKDPSSKWTATFKGYEDPVRTRLALDADNRPTISLWAVLKSMIGKDMTKMTLPVSFNEPTSLLQRVAEDLEYTDLLDMAAERSDPTERMLYVAAFAASEYCSTIGRVAKPFNPLLGETFEYARPDKGYRFFIEQVSHHPPIGAAWAEAERWEYFGESAVKSNFYGKSFDINPLGTWFLKLRPTSGGEELYTWKKVTSSVINIITGSPTVDNYGRMEIKNWTSGETCQLDFKARGWRASSAYGVSGKVASADGRTRWSVGGRWNDKIYARLTPGFEAVPEAPEGAAANAPRSPDAGSSQAFLLWQAHARPTGIPFNLTPFVVTLNALPERLRPLLPATDTRLRPDQRAMEDGAYDRAGTEKTRVEERQRATRRARESAGIEYQPRWFVKSTHPITGEPYWEFNPQYWTTRDQVARGAGTWENVNDIFGLAE